MAFALSAFADEINDNLDLQMEGILKHGINNIEIRGVDGKNISVCSSEEVKSIKKRLDDRKIKISAIGSPIGKINIIDSFDDHLQLFKKVIEIAKILETKYIRLFSFYIPKEEKAEKYRDEVLKRINMFVKTAKGTGLVLLHENEKDIYGDTAQRCFDILESIGDDTLKATFDPANFIQCQEEPYPNAFNLLENYIEYMHIKDADKDGNVVPAGKGIGNIVKILSLLKTKNYDGFLTLEPHLGNFSGLAALEIDTAYKNLPAGGERTFALAANSLKDILKNI